MFCVLLRRRVVSALVGHIFFHCHEMRLHRFFTVNSPVIFLKYTFELRISCLIRLDQFYTAFAGGRSMKKA